MRHKVGPKGQVVIKKEIRDKLGVEPGWEALQFLVNDHVEVYFLPPRTQPLAGGQPLELHNKKPADHGGAARGTRGGVDQSG